MDEENADKTLISFYINLSSNGDILNSWDIHNMENPWGSTEILNTNATWDGDLP